VLSSSTVIYLFFLMNVRLSCTTGLLNGTCYSEHYVIHVPYEVHTVHHHHVKKVPVYIKSHYHHHYDGWI
jgi:hypothetical protein